MIARSGRTLDGCKGLVIGIANGDSIAYGCARAFRAVRVELAVTYRGDHALPHVEPLARELEAPSSSPATCRTTTRWKPFSRRSATAGAGSTSRSTRLLSRRAGPSRAG